MGKDDRCGGNCHYYRRVAAYHLEAWRARRGSRGIALVIALTSLGLTGQSTFGGKLAEQEPAFLDEGNVAAESIVLQSAQCSPILFGDVDDDGRVDLDDVLCVLNGFAQSYTNCPLAFVDIVPCGGGDGVVDIDDVNAVLDAFSGLAHCPDPCRPCVENLPPVASVGVNRSVEVGQDVAFYGSGSFDPDGWITAHKWEFGDDTRSESTDPIHTYGASGTFIVTLTVTDSCGDVGSDQVTVTVTQPACSPDNLPPQAVAGPDRAGDVGNTITFDGSSSTDAEGTVVEYWWNFGDGYSTGWQSSAVADHVYADPALYTAKLWVSDNCGATSAADSVTITIQGDACLSNQPPAALAGAPRAGEVGAPIAFDAGASFDSDGWIQEYRWDFGDGSIGEGRTVEHAYQSAGNYLVTLTVTDNCGESDFSTAAATISESSFVELSPGLLGFVSGNIGTVQGVTLSPYGDRLYVASLEFGVIEFDISELPELRPLATSATFFNAQGVAVSDRFVMTGGATSGARVASLSTWGTPAESWAGLGIVAQGMALRDGLAFVAAGPGGLNILDVSNPANIQTESTVPMFARGVAISPDGAWAYVPANSEGLRLVDLSGGTARDRGGVFPVENGSATDVVLNEDGTLAFVAEYGGGLSVIDLGNPPDPLNARRVAVIPTNGPANRVAYTNHLVIVATVGLEPRLTIIDVWDPQNPVETAFVPGMFPSIDARNGLVAGALGSSGLLLVDVSDPHRPVTAAALNTGLPSRTACAVAAGIALVGGSMMSTTVLDLSDPDTPRPVSRIPSVAQDIAIEGTRGFLAAGFSGLKVVDLSDPSNPVITSTVPMFARGVTLSSDGDWAFVAAGSSGGLQILDISDANRPPIVRAALDTTGNATDIALNAAGTVAFVADYGSGLQIFDVNDRLNPRLIGSLATAGPAHRVATSGDLVLVATLGLEPQLEIVDVSAPANPSVVGTMPGLFEGVDTFAHYVLLAWSDLLIVDLFDPANPTIAFQVPTPGLVRSVDRFGDRVYLGDTAAVLDVVGLFGQ